MNAHLSLPRSCPNWLGVVRAPPQTGRFASHWQVQLHRAGAKKRALGFSGGSITSERTCYEIMDRPAVAGWNVIYCAKLTPQQAVQVEAVCRRFLRGNERKLGEWDLFGVTCRNAAVSLYGYLLNSVGALRGEAARPRFGPLQLMHQDIAAAAWHGKTGPLDTAALAVPGLLLYLLPGVGGGRPLGSASMALDSDGP